MTRITFRNVLLGGPVWCISRGKWRPAIVVTRGRTSCRVRLVGKDSYCTRPCDFRFVGRCLTKNGSDQPADRIMPAAEA